MDLTDTMKSVLSGKSSNSGLASQLVAPVMNLQPGHGPQSNDQQHGGAGVGYVTEKLYMLLQLYIQNKGWNPSVELLQCFSELKDSALLPSAAYLQVIANRLALDSQGRLVLRESGKIVLPYEHFANAVMLKHMSGPHGLHLSLEATMRAVIDSYSIGRENFGMEKEFIIEVVQSCPSAACRYYKNHMGVPSPFIDQSFQPSQLNSDFMGHLQQMSAANELLQDPNTLKTVQNQAVSNLAQNKILKSQQHVQQHQQVAVAQQQQQQQQITAAIIQQQNRAIAQQSLEKFGNLSALEKQRVLQQFDKKHYEGLQVTNINMVPQNVGVTITPQPIMVPTPSPVQPITPIPNIGASSNSNGALTPGSTSSSFGMVTPVQNHVPAVPQPLITIEQSQKPSDYSSSSRGSLECLESLSASNKDLLALHNGAWGNQDTRIDGPIGQDKIVRAFAELMKNMARMKTFIRPSMCKPYGKQSDSLQKTLMDTIALVQSLRNCLPAPHIPVSSWKSEDRSRQEPQPGIIDY